MLNLGFCECEQLYLHATKILADKQGAVLGKYTRGADQHNGRSYYWKTTPTKTFYLIFDSDGNNRILKYEHFNIFAGARL